MKYNQWYGNFWWILLCLSFWACENKEAPVREPKNILFILVDDLGHADLGVTGSQFYETPNVDALAKSGFVFNQGYAGSRVCSPSRATIMTGKFTASHGITDWIGAKTGEDWRSHQRHDKLLPAIYQHHLAHEEITLAEALKTQGYKTFYAGKWHLGKEGSYPEDHGFDINKGGWEKGSPIGGYFSPWENPKLENKVKGENLSMRLARETVDFIRANQQDKFFAMLSFYAVHSPIQTTRQKWAKYRDKAAATSVPDSSGFHMERVLPIRSAQDNPVYGGLVETMDEAVGLVLDELRILGLDQNTMVVFTSDNGGVASGDNYSTSNLPLRGGKGYQWEGGLRVPLIMRVPGQGSGNSNYPVTGADLYPTILDILGLELMATQHRDGSSVKAVIDGTVTTNSRTLFWHYPHYGNQGGEPSSVIRFEDWKLIHYWEDDRQELYDLQADPAEVNNVMSQHPDVAANLEQQLQDWLSSTNARIPIQDPEFDSIQAQKRKEYLTLELWPKLESQRQDMLSEDYQPNADWWGSDP